MSNYKIVATYNKDPMDYIYNLSSENNVINERIGTNVFNTHDYNVNYTWNSSNIYNIKKHIVETEGIVSPITFRNTINSLIKKGIGELLIRNVSSKLKIVDVNKLVRKNTNLNKGITLIKDNADTINNKINIKNEINVKTAPINSEDIRVKNNLSLLMGKVNTTLKVNDVNGLFYTFTSDRDNKVVKNLYNLSADIDRVRNNSNNKEYILNDYDSNKNYYVILKYNNLLNNNVFKGDVFTDTTPIKVIINGVVKYKNFNINTHLSGRILTISVGSNNNLFDINNNKTIDRNTFNYYIHEVISI